MCKPKEKKQKKFEETIRQITKRNRGVSVERVVKELNAYLRGWINYYARSNMKKWLAEKAGWIRRRVRQYMWKVWKKGGARVRHLKELGVPEWQITKYMMAASSNRYWRMAGFLGNFLTNKILQDELGLLNIEKYYEVRHAERMEMDRTYNSQLELIFV